jgi:hypothetical protein
MDAWHQNGGQQAPIDSRQHHLSDAVFLNGLRSDPNKLANVSNTSIQHRSVDGKTTHDVDPSGGITTKVVAASDTLSNPFADATAYHSTNHSGGAISETSTDGTALHTRIVNPADGHQITVTKSGKTHTITMNPDDGISIVPNVAMSMSAPSMSMGAGGAGGGLTMTPSGLELTEVVAVQLTPTTLANLPSSPQEGTLALLTDIAGTVTWRATLTSGGGTSQALVRFNGSNWIIIG